MARTTEWRQNGAMPSIQIKDVPASTHTVLVRRAAAAHQSLQEYLRSRLIAEASRPTLEEVVDRIAALPPANLSVEQINAAIRADRESH